MIPTEESTTEPPPEPTTQETPQTQQQQPSIELANAPIGGNVDADGIYQCAEVNWLGRNPIPAGTAIRVGAATLDPGGIFQFDQAGCRPDERSCVDVTWQEENFRPCYVGVRQIAGGTADEPVRLILAVTAVCASQADCDSLVGDQAGSQITFVPDELPAPETPTETPTDTPPETPTQTPTGSAPDAPTQTRPHLVASAAAAQAPRPTRPPTGDTPSDPPTETPSDG